MREPSTDAASRVEGGAAGVGAGSAESEGT